MKACESYESIVLNVLNAVNLAFCFWGQLKTVLPASFLVLRFIVNLVLMNFLMDFLSDGLDILNALIKCVQP